MVELSIASYYTERRETGKKKIQKIVGEKNPVCHLSLTVSLTDESLCITPATIRHSGNRMQQHVPKKCALKMFKLLCLLFIL